MPRVTDRHVLSNPRGVIPFQVETCRKQGLRWCPAFDSSTNRTMFFNQGRFLRCWHSFHNRIALALHLNNRPVSAISSPVNLRVMRDGRTVAVYNSGCENRPQLRFSFINDDLRLRYQVHSLDCPTESLRTLSALTDYVEITSGETIVTDFRLVEVSSATGHPVTGEVTDPLHQGHYTPAAI